MACIEAYNLWKSYAVRGKKITVLKGVNFAAEEGDLVAVVGPSGAGKTTLLHVLSTVDWPERGVLYHLGVQIRRSEDWRAKWRREYVGIVFQQAQLVPTLTVLENVILPMYLAGKFKHSQKERAIKLLEMVGIADKADRYPSELSGGEQQRAAIARALANDPSIIIADEPASNLDKENRRIVASIFQRLAEEGRCVVYSTHEEELKRVATKVCEVKGGVVKCY